MNLISKKTLFIIVVIIFCSTLFADKYSYSPLKSLIVPGWGQIDTDRTRGYFQLGAECAFIASYIYNDNEGKAKKEQSVNYAVKYAHVKSKNFNNIYFHNIGRHNSSGFEAGGYNYIVYNDAIALYPNDTEKQIDYVNSHAIPDNKSWKWDSKNNRYKYNQLRRDYFTYQDNAKLFIGMIVANHVVSFVDMLISYRKNKSKHNNINLSTSINNENIPMVNISYSF